LGEIAEIRKLVQPRFDFRVMMIGAKQLVQTNQAATFEDREGKGLSARNGATKCFLRSR
jgi:hypothetical protein